MSSLLEEIQGFNAPGTVLLLSEGTTEVNTAMRHKDGSWALGGKQDPYTDEKLTAGIENMDLHVSVIHWGDDL